MFLPRALKVYCRDPTSRRRAVGSRFDRIFKRRTGFVLLDRLLARLYTNKAELLLVLERPEIPLHNNGSENDIRCQVIKRRISGGTRSDAGRGLCSSSWQARQCRCPATSPNTIQKGRPTGGPSPARAFAPPTAIPIA